MSEFLLDKESYSENTQKMSTPIGSENEELSSSTKNNLFEFDIIADTLKHIYSKSKLKKNLSSALSIFYTYPILIILFSFLIGSFFFGLSMLFIFFKIFENLMKPIIFIILFTLVFCISLIIIRVIDDFKNQGNIGAKWERNNIVKILGISLTLIILTIGAFFFHAFINNLLAYKNKNDILLNYNEIKYNNYDKKSFENDFFLIYIINCFLLDKSQIESENSIISNYFGDEILKKLHMSLLISCIPLFIFCFNKLIKVFLIEVKFTIPKFIIYINFFFFIILIFIDHSFFDKNNFNWFIISLIEIILLSLIYLGFILLKINSVYKLNKNPKDKNFTINKFDLGLLFLIFTFDLIDLIGSSLIYMSLLINFINYAYNNETYKDLNNSVLFLRIGFLLCIISNSFYYGHFLLSLIFRPIALQYAPVKLKKFYIRANRNLGSFISFKFDFNIIRKEIN